MFGDCAMDHLVGLLPNSVQSMITSFDCPTHIHTHHVGIAVLSLAALYLGYLYLLGRREAPVVFNVPVPAEIRPNWTGKTWDEIPQEEEKRVLEGQVRGVSY